MHVCRACMHACVCVCIFAVFARMHVCVRECVRADICVCLRCCVPTHNISGQVRLQDLLPVGVKLLNRDSLSQITQRSASMATLICHRLSVTGTHMNSHETSITLQAPHLTARLSV